MTLRSPVSAITPGLAPKGHTSVPVGRRAVADLVPSILGPAGKRTREAPVSASFVCKGDTGPLGSHKTCPDSTLT